MSGSPQTTHSMFPARIDAQRRLGIASFQLYPVIFGPGRLHVFYIVHAVRRILRPGYGRPYGIRQFGKPHVPLGLHPPAGPIEANAFFLTLVVNFHFEQAVVPIEFPNQGIRILFGDEPRSRIVQHRTVPGSGPGNLRRHDAQRPVQGNGRSSRRRRPTPNRSDRTPSAESRSDRRHRYDTRHIPKRKGPA